MEPMGALQSYRNLRQFQQDPATFLNGQTNDFSEAFVGPRRFYVCRDPDLANYFLKENPANYPHNRFVYKQIEPITGREGLVQLTGEKWKRYRSLTNKLFHSDRFSSYAPIIEHCVAELIKRWIDSPPLFLNDEILILVLRISGLIFLHRDLTIEAPEVVRAFLELNRLCGLRLRSVTAPPLWVPTPMNQRIKAAREVLRNFVASSQGGPLPTLLRGDKSVGDQISTFLFAGHETTATSVLWTLALLAQNPRYQKEEFIASSYQEALRLFPPAWILARDVLEEEEVRGHLIKAGSSLIIDVRAIHRHPRFWLKPDLFRPERFLSGEVASRAFIPFGGGPKVCSGKGLASLEANIILEKLIQAFSFSPTPNTSLAVEEMITAHPKHELQLKVEKRC